MSLGSQKRKSGEENIFEETMPKNFPNLENEISLQIQETQWTQIGYFKESHAHIHHKEIGGNQR